MKFFRSKKDHQDTDEPASKEGQGSVYEQENKTENVVDDGGIKETKTRKEGLFSRLSKTRKAFSEGLFGFLERSSSIDDDFFEELEDQLVLADLGADTSEEIVIRLRDDVRKYSLTDSGELVERLKAYLIDMLSFPEPIDFVKKEGSPYVILMVGVNGVGKTTTLAKISKHYQDQGQSVMMAACDTFRAAAIEQLQSWGEKLGVTVVAQSHGADAAAVAFDAYSAACARGMDVLLIDTAGRQHTHGDLMEQLKKIKKVLDKTNAGIPHEVLLTVDAGNGQNIHSQVESFSKMVDVNGLCVTKLDGTAKGGVVISVIRKFGIPVRYLGVGEKVTDLKQFFAAEFIDAMLPDFSSKDD
ncbi:MAG: signal recognition particle-docking protein FtsY [Gammaproteobacteria bacterium]|nr:signal recognition particle-docking protein FtsY [Gammaproteobacteria bacterium]